eukprot:14204172-Heterocapsa_arctica.AAC.1
MTVAISVQVTAGTKRCALHPGSMAKERKVAEFAREQIGGMGFMGTVEGNPETQRRKRDKELMLADQEVRTIEMDHIVTAEEMGKVCKHFTSIDDFKANQTT